jgi:hypothetical protein
MKNFTRKISTFSRVAITSFLSVSPALAANPDGLYLMVRVWMGSSPEISGWYFKNGRVSNRPLGNIANFDFNAAAKADPDKTGTYTISGKKMIFNWANGKKQEGDYEPGDHGGFFWDMGNFTPVQPFPAGTKLSGVFEGGASAGYGSVSNAHTITFSPDGTYKMSSASSLKSDGRNGNQLYGGASGEESGTYSINGTTMTMTGGGKTRQVLTFPYDDGSKGPAPRRIMFDAIMMKHTK